MKPVLTSSLLLALTACAGVDLPIDSQAAVGLIPVPGITSLIPDDPTTVSDVQVSGNGSPIVNIDTNSGDRPINVNINVPPSMATPKVSAAMDGDERISQSVPLASESPPNNGEHQPGQVASSDSNANADDLDVVVDAPEPPVSDSPPQFSSQCFPTLADAIAYTEEVEAYRGELMSAEEIDEVLARRCAEGKS